MLTKVNYVDDTTVIHAKNLNDIQDAIIELESSPAGGGVLSVNGKTPDDAGAVDLTAADVGAVGVAQIKVWISPDPTSPASIFGGSWVQIKDRFVLAAGDTYAAGSTGGEATHALIVNEMPSHGHALRPSYSYNSQILSADTTSTNYGKVAGVPGSSGWLTNYANTSSEGPIQKTGWGAPHNNMPPYLSLYVWMRVTEEAVA